ncbi:hypothetical protein OP10G_3078 [Fimbriimonas ginsengisoli Gsoil 348]|uniref:DUF4352 domain-containing protein n=1 Tax=Fimbriimonas ginsengisoli Gsoil 348 TaxID=661478 RepID=A0A068NSN1_FIMGI|nr:hypothetical protein OP10G_3078 [Fimbriimonas ginsengisoli Gsoil 348]
MIAPGTSVHFDDWFFTARNARRVGRIGNLDAPPGKAFYIVDVNVRSEAKRVSFTFRPESVRITLDGHQLNPAEAAQRELPLPSAEIEHGEQATYSLALVGPAKGRELRVKFEAGGIGEWLDAILGENKEVLFRL